MHHFKELLLKHPVELILILVACGITIAVFMLSLQEDTIPLHSVETLADRSSMTNDDNPQTYTIDISGAVSKPNVYEVPAESTISDIIKIAGGFSEEADLKYIGRNLNLAKGITDKEKIYIPSISDIEEDAFTEESLRIEITQSETQTLPEKSEGISINTATSEELDMLPSIGPVTAQKIIDNRPYSTLEDLLSKKVVNNTNFEKIRNLIVL